MVLAAVKENRTYVHTDRVMEKLYYCANEGPARRATAGQ